VEVALIGAVLALILAHQAPPAEPPAAKAPPPAPPVVKAPEPPVTRELVVVLPDANGRVGTVVVERGEQRIVLNEAYATSRITADGEIRLEKLPEPEVKAAFAPVVTALPPRPMSFLLYFARGSDALTDASQAELERMLAELRRRAEADIVVVGHTDRLGKSEANDQLSLLRAERVKSDLVAQGIVAARIRADGRGEREPLVPTEDGVEEPKNRRVEIRVR
jgi:outer membrane protein OmpA-like peptidoglycan-associated protein